MASLSDRIASNKKVLTRDQSGQLVEQTQEEVQSLAQKAGLAAPPITPVGQAAIGANADQQKMAGTPMQKSAALSMASGASPDLNLQDALRRQQVRTETTVAEQGRIQKSENLQNLGSLGDRVNDFINAQKTKLDTQAAHLAAAEQGSNKAGEKQSLADLKPTLEQLASDPTNMQLQLQVNKALGYDGTRQLSPQEIQSLYRSANESIAQSGAEAINDSLTAQDLINQGGLGYDAGQLSELLGVPPEQVGAMSVGDIHNKINELMAQEFSTTQQLEQKAFSGELGAAERALARQGAREASATGIRSTEAEFANLEQEIAQAGQVSFAGRQMSLEDMLSNDTISKVISDYLSAAPDSPQRTGLEKSEPQLVAFIKRNENVLNDAAAQIGAGATQFQTLQTENQKAASLGGVLPPDLAAKLVPGYHELSATSFDPNSVPVLAAVQGMNPDQQKVYTNTLGTIASFPGSIEDLKSLSPEQIKALQLENPGGPWTQWRDDMQQYQQIQNIPEHDVDSIANALFGTEADWTEELGRNKANTVLGVGRENKSLRILDADSDGRIDSGAQLKQRIASETPRLGDPLTGTDRVHMPRNLKETSAPEPFDRDLMMADLVKGDRRAVSSSVSSSLAKYAADGELDAGEITKVYGGGASSPESLQGRIHELNYLLNNGQLSGDTKKQINTLINENRDRLSASVRDTIFNKSKFDGVVATRIFDYGNLEKMLSRMNVGDNVSMLDKPTRRLYESLQEYKKLMDAKPTTDAQRQNNKKRFRKLEETVNILRKEMGYG